MTHTTYLCNFCRRTHNMKFARTYSPFRKWLMTCPLCRKYTLHFLLRVINLYQFGQGLR